MKSIRALLVILASLGWSHAALAMKPKAVSFEEVFRAQAAHSKLSIQWLEQILTAPEETLITFNLETPAGLLKLLNGRSVKQFNVQDIGKWKVHDLLDVGMSTGVITQSCGQSTMLVHSVLAPSSYKEAEKNKASVNDIGVLAAVRKANALSKKDHQPHYCIVEGGGHSFTVELLEGRAKIYQSFFNGYTMATDLDRKKSFKLGEFLWLLVTAMEPHDALDVVDARRELFSSQAFHPDGNFKVTIYGQEAGFAERLQQHLAEGQKKWEHLLAEAASAHLKKEVVIEEPKAGTVFDKVPLQHLADKGLYLYDANYKEVSTDKLEVNKEYNLHFFKTHLISGTVTALDKGGGTCTIKITDGSNIL